MTLPYDIHSPDQISALTMELRSYINAQRDASHRSDHSTGGSTKPHASAQLGSLLDASGNLTASQLLEELEKLLREAPTVHLMTAIQPGHQLKQQITGWFRANIHENAMLTFAERRDLGGGIVVRTGSRIYDFSFKRKILDNKHRITEIAGLARPAPASAAPAPQATPTETSNV